MSKAVLTVEVDDKGSATIKQMGQNIQDSMGRAKESVGGLGSSWANVTAGMAAFIYTAERVISYAKSMADPFLQAEQAQMKLAMAMKNSTGYSTEAFRGLKEYADQIQSLTTFDNDLIVSQMAVLKSFGMTDEQVKRSIRSATDLSVVMDRDLGSAAQAIAKAFMGNTTALSRFGITIDQTKPPAERFNDILLQIEKRFGGQAQAMVETYGGKISQLKNQVADAQKGVLEFATTTKGSMDPVTAGLMMAGDRTLYAFYPDGALKFKVNFSQ